MPNRVFLRWTGAALAAGGALDLLINTCLTPLLPRPASFAEVVASAIFPWRQGFAVAGAALLVFGSVGLYLRQADRAGRFGAVAFVVALLGSALVLALEWEQLFAVRDFALRAPKTLTTLYSGHGPSLLDISAMVAVGTFALGWIALAVVTLRARVLSRSAAILVIAGFFAVPLLQPFLPGVWGAIVSNSVLGAGWFWLGCEIAASPQPITALSSDLLPSSGPSRRCPDDPPQT
jgi:hypothetical protein